MNGMAKPYVNLKELTKYIEQMRFKKAINGFNRTDVFEKMTDMQNIFQQYIDQYEKILDEKDAYISELSARMQNVKENYKQKLLKRDSIINKLNRELEEYNELLKKYKDRNNDSEIAGKKIQKAHTTARLIIEQAKIDAELEALKSHERQNAEKERYRKWKLHTETASHEVLDNLKQMEKYITHLDDKLIDNATVKEEIL